MQEKGIFESVARDSLTVYANKGILLLTGIIYTYLIANILGPEDYGLVNYVISFLITVLNLIGMYTVLKISTVFTARNKSKKLFWLLVKINYALALTVVLFTFFFPEILVNYLEKGTNELWTTALILVALMPGTMIFHSLLIGFKKFGKILKISLYENISNLVFAVYFVLFLNLGIFGVIYARAISLAIALLLSFKYYKELKFENKEVKKEELKEFAVGSIAMNWIREGLNLAVLWTLGFLSAATLGIYFLVDKFVSYFIKIPLDGLTEVMMPYTAEKHDDLKSVNKYTEMSTKFFVLFSFVFGILFVLIGNLFIDFLFPEFKPSAFLLPLYAVLNLFLANNPFGVTLRALNKTKMLATSLAVELVVFLISAYFLIPLFGLEGLLMALILSRAGKMGYYLAFQKSVGLNIQVIPRLKDIKYFYENGLKARKKILKI